LFSHSLLEKKSLPGSDALPPPLFLIIIMGGRLEIIGDIVYYIPFGSILDLPVLNS
jgi:hypothetical protein